MKHKTRLIRRRPTKSAQDIERIASLEARLGLLEGRIAGLENREKSDWHPNTTPLSPNQPWPWPDDGTDDARCHVCGNRYKDMTFYVCNHPNCPGRVTVTYATSNVPGAAATAGTPLHLIGTSIGNRVT
jgi:hypothetical protein